MSRFACSFSGQCVPDFHGWATQEACAAACEPQETPDLLYTVLAYGIENLSVTELSSIAHPDRLRIIKEVTGAATAPVLTMRASTSVLTALRFGDIKQLVNYPYLNSYLLERYPIQDIMTALAVREIPNEELYEVVKTYYDWPLFLLVGGAVRHFNGSPYFTPDLRSAINFLSYDFTEYTEDALTQAPFPEDLNEVDVYSALGNLVWAIRGTVVDVLGSGNHEVVTGWVYAYLRSEEGMALLRHYVEG